MNLLDRCPARRRRANQVGAVALLGALLFVAPTPATAVEISARVGWGGAYRFDDAKNGATEPGAYDATTMARAIVAYDRWDVLSPAFGVTFRRHDAKLPLSPSRPPVDIGSRSLAFQAGVRWVPRRLRSGRSRVVLEFLPSLIRRREEVRFLSIPPDPITTQWHWGLDATGAVSTELRQGLSLDFGMTWFVTRDLDAIYDGAPEVREGPREFEGFVGLTFRPAGSRRAHR